MRYSQVAIREPDDVSTNRSSASEQAASLLGEWGHSGRRLPLPVPPRSPWSLKTVVARRGQCINNLKVIAKTLQDRGIPLDASHSGGVCAVIEELELVCPEGTDIHGRPASYAFVSRGQSGIITEEIDNHPARSRLLAGAVTEERFDIDSAGHMSR